MSEWVLEVAARNKSSPSGASYDFKTVWKMLIEAEEETPLLMEKQSYEDAMLAQPKELIWFPDWWLDSYSYALEYKWACNYLHDRGVSPETAMMLDLRGEHKDKRICFPVRDFEGILRGFHGRTIDPEIEPRYKMFTYAGGNNPIVWYGEHWVDTSKPIVVVEGPFDVASVIRVYTNVVSPLFANPSKEKLMRMADALEWVTLLDNGKAGDNGRKRISKLFPDHMITHLKPPEGEDAGSMSENDLRELLKPYVKLQTDMQ